MIVLDHVSTMVGGVALLSDVSLSVTAGERVGVFGGPGARLVARIVGALAPVAAGRVEIDGIDATREVWRVRARVASAEPPPPVCDRLSVGEYLDLAGFARGVRLDERLANADLRAGETIGGLDPLRRRRLGCLAAEARRPAVVTTAVAADDDGAWRRRWVDACRANGSTVLVAGEEAASVRGLCDRMLHLREGRL